ncbi:Small-conductance mechanosensitive channel [Enhygromyxa salina]|uniref:Small-conductance mechanosensitive channel n=1 Tax=Enhygromyxa salina TaxID=215803 RepID=A0A2S9XD10_9BACT|nr:mechanosensitive ion channel domain-containing protein [Enhygromyxa salina]PRP90746.1 Small-conductance mechanosensitive channel [Enhygromyxa salina]
MKDLPVPEALQPYMGMIVAVATALLIFLVGWILSKSAHGLVTRALRKRKLDEALARFLAALTQYMVLAAALIVALAQVGIETTSLVALLGAAGLAIGLALQGSLAHFASGVMLLLFRPFTIGDFVDAGGKSGIVNEIGLFATSVTTFDNHRVTIPNGSITGGPITNYTILGKRRAVINVGVAYGSDIDEVSAMLLEAVTPIETVLDDPAPAAVFVELGASSLDFAVRVWAENEHFGAMQHTARKAVYDRLNAAGIDIPFSQIVVHQAEAAA